MIFHFSATGNSLALAKALSDAPRSILLEEEGSSYKDEMIGIVCPVYGHEIPSVVKEFLTRHVFDTKYFFVLLTYGKHHGNAPIHTKSFLEGLGITASYINVFQTVDNYLPMFDMDEEKKDPVAEEKAMERIREDLLNRRRFILPPSKEEEAIHKAFLEATKDAADLPADYFSILDTCTSCAICVRLCPKGCYHLEEKAHWQRKGCMECLACVQNCPVKAILIPGEKNRHARYRHPKVSLQELLHTRKDPS